MAWGRGDGVEDAGDARPREAELRLGAVPRGRQGSGAAARGGGVGHGVDGFLASALIVNLIRRRHVLIPASKLADERNPVHSAFDQSTSGFMATTYCSTTSEGHAGAELAKDNRELKQDAAVDIGRSAEDVSTCRRSKTQPQLTLSRNSSTDEAQLESGISPESRF